MDAFDITYYARQDIPAEEEPYIKQIDSDDYESEQVITLLQILND